MCVERAGSYPCKFSAGKSSENLFLHSGKKEETGTLTSRKEEDLSGIDIYRRSARRWQIFTKFVSRNSPGPFSTLIKKTFLDLGEWNNLFLPPLSLPILGERFPAHTTNSPRVNTKNLGDFGFGKEYVLSIVVYKNGTLIISPWKQISGEIASK